jgi:hypothetical protein
MLVKMVIMLVAVFSLIIAANVGGSSMNQKTTPMLNASSDFYANITFNVFEGEGCGCIPLGGVPLTAIGRDTEHSTSGITDDDGRCVLGLEYDKTYRVNIQQDNFESVLFDFVVIDDQTFSFHMKEIEVSIPYISFIQMMLQKLLLIKSVLS